jgi:acyl-CoA oxidase
MVKQLAAGAAEAAAPARPPPPRPRGASALEDAGAYLREAGRAPSSRSPPCAFSPAELAASPAATLGALREAARVLAVRAAAAMQAHVAAGQVAYEVAWSERASVELVEAGRAHARYLLAACFDAALAGADGARAAGRPALRALGLLRDLHVASACDEGACRVLLESGHLTAAHTLAVRARVLELLPPLRRDAVPLVDAFGLSDLELNSVLGRNDGDVYGPMLEWARRSPLNATQVVDGFEQHIRPIMGHASL